MSILINAVEKGLVPDFAIRYGIRNLLKKRLDEITDNFNFHRNAILKELDQSKLAIETKAANEQHYEVPSDFFKLVLGTHLKYSCSYYPNETTTLDQAEIAMLELYTTRAQLEDGMSILELGCGWGSLTLFLARKYPHSQITAISNSKSQKIFIEDKLKKENLNNVKIITTDINNFSIDQQFDRIISIEMFEHVRNYQELFSKVSSWLKNDGKVFIHIFCHKEATYFFETEGDDNWMGKYFFTGGIMPSFDLFERVQQSLKLSEKWQVDGKHYQKTSEDWFKNMDKNKDEIMLTLAKAYGPDAAKLWFNRWKIFFASCAELFGYNEGEEWFVGHFLFTKNL